MTAFDRSTALDRRISEALEEIAVPQRPDYLDDIFQRTARMSQRPRWTFLERWLPMDTALPRPGFTRLPVRTFLVFGLVALLAAAALVIAGSRQRVPAPFGPAGNGAIAYSHAGDLYVRDSLTGQERLLFGGAGIEAYPSYSPDGRWLAWVSTFGGVDHFSVARADGSASRQVAVIPPGNAQVPGVRTAEPWP
jgi:WD40-like Beta Propeller Repeat